MSLPVAPDTPPSDLSGNPLDVLASWIADAESAGLPVPSTMTFATAGADGVPHARTVLVTAVDAVSLRFHSSNPTSKTRDLIENPQVAGVFLWPSLGRQAIVHGRAELLSPEVSRSAYRQRPRQLQLVAWAYEELIPAQSPDGGVPPGSVEREFARYDDDPASAAMPPTWTTVLVTPARVDFWQAGTESSPPRKTRFLVDGEGWRQITVLP